MSLSRCSTALSVMISLLSFYSGGGGGDGGALFVVAPDEMRDGGGDPGARLGWAGTK